MSREICITSMCVVLTRLTTLIMEGVVDVMCWHTLWTEQQADHELTPFPLHKLSLYAILSLPTRLGLARGGQGEFVQSMSIYLMKLIAVQMDHDKSRRW